MNLLEAKFISESVQILPRLRELKDKKTDVWDHLKSHTQGVPLHTGKAGYSFVLSLASLIQGYPDSLAAKVNATAGILGLILVFFIARNISNPLAGLYSVAALASSTFYLLYCRAGLSDQVFSVFFLLGIFLYTRFWACSTAARFWIGLAFGYGFTCAQWRGIYPAVLLSTLEIIISRLKHWKLKLLVERIGLVAAGFLTPIILFQIPYVVVRMTAGPLPFRDYWSQLGERSLERLNLIWFRDVGEMTRQYWLVNGPVFPILVGLAWLFLLGRFFRKRRPEDLVLLFFSWVPFLYFSCMKYGGIALPRTTAILIPVAALCVGQLLSSLHRKLLARWRLFSKYSFLVAFLAVFILFLQALPRHFHTGMTRSGYPAAAQYISQTGKEKFLVLETEPVWRFYLGRVNYFQPQGFQELIEKAEPLGIEYLVVDHCTLYSKYGMTFTKSLIGKLAPVAVFQNPVGHSFAYLLDLYGLEKSLRMARDPDTEKIYLFRIRDIASALDRGLIG